MTAPPPASYASLFGDPDLNPLGTGLGQSEILTGLYQNWASPTMTGKELLEIVLNQFESQPIGGLGVFVTGTDGQPRLGVVHGARKYPGPLITHSPLANRSFGYQGDLSDSGFATVVEISPTLFDLTDEINLLKLDHYKSTLGSDPTLGQVKPVADDAAQGETVETRNTMSIPFGLVGSVFGESLTAREAFFAVDAQLTDPTTRPLKFDSHAQNLFLHDCDHHVQRSNQSHGTQPELHRLNSAHKYIEQMQIFTLRKHP